MPLPVTAWALEELKPHEWVHVADFLSGVLSREPLRHGSGWNAERMILGCLALELRRNAIDAGEPAEIIDWAASLPMESYLTIDPDEARRAWG